MGVVVGGVVGGVARGVVGGRHHGRVGRAALRRRRTVLRALRAYIHRLVYIVVHWE